MTNKNESNPLNPKIVNDIIIPEFPEPQENLIIPLDSDFHAVTDEETDIIYVLVPYWYWNLIIKWKVQMTRIVKTLTNTD